MSAAEMIRWAIDNPVLSLPAAAAVAWTVITPNRSDPHRHTYQHSPRGSKGYEARQTRAIAAAASKKERASARAKRDGGR